MERNDNGKIVPANFGQDPVDNHSDLSRLIMDFTLKNDLGSIDRRPIGRRYDLDHETGDRNGDRGFRLIPRPIHA
jgi:hypothetical protein